jgi:RNA polymerase sigma-70 factor (ECF subfamily)
MDLGKLRCVRLGAAGHGLMSDLQVAPADAHEDQDEGRLLAALRTGDEAAFLALIDRHGGAMFRMARLFVRSPEAAADVVQETWLGVVRGLDRFEGRASVRTWIFRILLNRARSRGQRDGHWITFSALAGREAARGPAAIDPAEFSDDPSSWPGHWVREPRRWAASAEEELLSAELLRHVSDAIAGLPTAQRTVIELRDVGGWAAADVCSLLDISAVNQRVLLHRARSRVRALLDGYLHDR